MKPTHIRTIHPSGYPIIFEIEEGDPKLAELIAMLNKWGFRPDIAGDTWVRTPEGAPICQRHNAVMNKREKQGDTWYSHQVTTKDGELLWCRGYAGPNSPGFDADIVNPEGHPQQHQQPQPAPQQNGSNNAAPAPPTSTADMKSANDDLFS